MLELGGGIFLENLESIDPGRLIIVKKIVGNYTKNISNKTDKFEKIIVRLEEGDNYKVIVKVHADKEYIAEGERDNLFFALDDALCGVTNQFN